MKHVFSSYLQSSSSLLPRLAYFLVRFLPSKSRIVGFMVDGAWHYRVEGKLRSMYTHLSCLA